MRALPEPIELRQARPEDAEVVKELVWEGISSYREWAPHWQPSEPTREQQERIQANFSNPDVCILMAHDGDELAGVISIAAATIAAAEAPPPGTIYLWQMFVRPAWQGRGLAGALHDRVVEEARARGFSRMILWAAEGAVQARRFYEREGWQATGETDPESKFGLPLVQYELML